MGEPPSVSRIVSGRTLEYGPGGKTDRSVANAIQAIANRARAMWDRRRMSLRDKERIRAAGERMVERLINRS